MLYCNIFNVIYVKAQCKHIQAKVVLFLYSFKQDVIPYYTI